MPKIYTKNTWVDEELIGGDVLYDVLTSGDTPIHEDVKIQLANTVDVEGTRVNAGRMNNIEDGIDELDDKLIEVDEKIITPYRLSVSVASNDLIVALKDKDGNDPSPSSPVRVQIGSTMRTISSALSITIPDGTNWFNSGSVELGTLLVPYFVYLVWDSNSSAVALTIARKSHYRIVASTMSTTTSENHIYGYSGFTAGDDMANIGYFEATLSLSGTGHLWTVPTFTNDNLKHEKTLVSRWRTWNPVWTALGSGTPTYGSVAVAFARYQVVPSGINHMLRASGTTGGSTVTTILATLPFQSKTSADASGASVAIGFGSVSGVVGGTGVTPGTPDRMSMFRYDLADMGIGAGRVVNISGFMEV